jgi:hypothetical protein
VSVFFFLTIVFLTFNASSEVHKFDNLTVAEEETRTFTDASNNILEFKFYPNKEMMY